MSSIAQHTELTARDGGEFLAESSAGGNHTSHSLSDLIQLGKIFAASGFFKDSRDAAQCITKIIAGRELGIAAVASMTGIFIVKERVTLSANLMGAIIKRSGRYDYRVRELSEKGATLEFFQRSGGEWESIGVSTFSWQDAVQAGLAGGDNWRKHPRNMVYARALSNGAKWYCPDAFAGGPVYTPDELGAEVDAETGEILRPAERGLPVASLAAPAAPATPAARGEPMPEEFTESTEPDAIPAEIGVDTARMRGNGTPAPPATKRTASAAAATRAERSPLDHYNTLASEAVELGIPRGEIDVMAEDAPVEFVRDAFHRLKGRVEAQRRAKRTERTEEGSDDASDR